jgi:hypothetical protein
MIKKGVPDDTHQTEGGACHPGVSQEAGRSTSYLLMTVVEEHLECLTKTKENETRMDALYTERATEIRSGLSFMYFPR